MSLKTGKEIFSQQQKICSLPASLFFPLTPSTHQPPLNNWQMPPVQVT